MYYVVSLLLSRRLLVSELAGFRRKLCGNIDSNSKISSLEFRQSKSWNFLENRFYNDFRPQRGHRKIVAPDHALWQSYL